MPSCMATFVRKGTKTKRKLLPDCLAVLLICSNSLCHVFPLIHLQAKFLGSHSVRQKIPHVMRKFLPFQADFHLIMRYAHTHADNFLMRMCASSRITTQSHENYIAAFILDIRLHMSQSLNSQYEYLLWKPILSHMTIVFCMTKPMPHSTCV